MSERMNPKLVWVAAVLAVGLSLGAAYALKVSPKMFLAIYGGLFAALGFASTFLTEAKRSTAALAFGVAALVFGIVVFIIIRSALKKAGAEMGAEGAGATVGSAFGTIYGVAYFLDALIAGIGGVLMGRKVQAGMT